MTFAVKPPFAATGYGYLKIGQAIEDSTKQFGIEAFVKKPDAEVVMDSASGHYA